MDANNENRLTNPMNADELDGNDADKGIKDQGCSECKCLVPHISTTNAVILETLEAVNDPVLEGTMVTLSNPTQEV